MANLLGSYSPNDVYLNVNGVPVSGFVEGTFITVSYNTDAATLYEGADGSPALAMKRGARGGSIKFTLMQTSMSNNVLGALMQAQKFAASGGAAITAGVANVQGGEMATMPRGAFSKEPDIVYSGSIEGREYTLIGQIQTATAGCEV